MSIECIPDFPDFVREKGSQFLITGGGGRGLDFLLPVIVFMRLKSFLVSLPASIIWRRVCGFLLFLSC